jgi:hypothetical protein
VRGAKEPYRYEREVEEFLRWSPHVRNSRDKRASALTREQLTELRRLLASFAETSGLADGNGEVEAAAEARAVTDERIDTAEERAEAAEHRAEAAERAAEKAVQRAKKAEQRAAEAALKATERAKKAERRAGAAAEEAAQRAAAEVAKRAAEQREEADRAATEQRRAEAERRAAARRSVGSPVEHYDDLAAEEVIALLASLERDDLQMLREHERKNANRTRVLSAIDSVLARRQTPV